MLRLPLRVLQAPTSTSPEAMLVLGFAGAIVAGALLLWLPWAHRGAVGPLEALFTATSAVCVTGLVVVDTGTEFTPFGQIVILLLIQTGGLGVMTFAALAFDLMGRRLSLRARAALADSLVQRNLAGELWGLFRRMLRIVLIIECMGAILLFFGMWPGGDPSHAAWSALFHSVSAFCNAGFSLYQDSLTGLRFNKVVYGGVVLLIVTGGIGHPVLVDLWRLLRRAVGGERSPSDRLSLHSRIALLMSGSLIVIGAVLLLVLGITEQISGFAERAGAAVFQSVTARTAGFNTVDIGALPLGSVFLLVLLMIIGGSPGSCAGGIKTTTFALWGASLWSGLRGEHGVKLLGRYIPGELVRRGWMSVELAVVWNAVGLLFLLATEGGSGVGFHEVLFEQVSAFATVGLTTGLTPGLTAVGKLWIIATMFAGRVGLLTLMTSMTARQPLPIRCPEGRLMIG